MSEPTPEGTPANQPPANMFTPQAMPPPEPEADEPTPVERLRAEVVAEALPDGVVAVTLIPAQDDAPAVLVRVLPGLDWSSNAMEAVNIGNWNYWASECLYDDDFQRIWLRVNPTNREVLTFLDELNRVASISVGELQASRRSSKRTARR